MKYINVFASQSEYEQSVKTYPSVNLIKDTNDIICKHGNTPFYIEALEDLTVQFERSCQYNLGDGWTTLLSFTASPIVPAGQKIFIKADDVLTSGRYGKFTITGKCNIGGNLLSLCGKDHPEINSISNSSASFSRMFAEQPICSAINLRIPISYAYSSSLFSYMFLNCIHLKYPPKSIRICNSNSCCAGMFKGCESLLFAPELPSTTLTDYCYNNMFNGCKSLLYAPKLPATLMKVGCYGGMFANCTSLIQAPELPATELATSCYCYYSSSGTGSYVGMFENCASLVEAPELPATILKEKCYANMFKGCTSLKKAPVLPATELVGYCYYYMFNGCSKIDYIKAMFTTTPSSNYTPHWVSGVAATGTFVKNAAATWNVTGSNGVPTDWTVETAEA